MSDYSNDSNLVTRRVTDGNFVTRREFTLEWALAVLAGATITITGCGGGTDDDNRSPVAPTPVATDVTGSISANHGHTAVITSARLAQGGALTLDITGQATHPHSVDLTASELTQISNRQQVTKTSTTDAFHSHTVTFN